nr:hypothetical protein [Streptococcus oralis]
MLIDYKGGGMANLFKKLPHLLGTITNLDGAQSIRATRCNGDYCSLRYIHL